MNKKPDISAVILELCKVPRTCTELERKTFRSRTNVMVAIRKLLAEGRLKTVGLRKDTQEGIKPQQYQTIMVEEEQERKEKCNDRTD